MTGGIASRRGLPILIAFGVCLHPAGAQTQPAIIAGAAELRFESNAGTYGIAILLQAAAAFRQGNPLAAQVDAASGTALL